MTTSMPTEYPHITSDADVCSGRPRISGTRIRVMDIVVAHEAGHSPAELQSYFSSRLLTLAEIYAALAYYHDHKDEVNGTLAEDERLSEKVEREKLNPTANRSR